MEVLLIAACSIIAGLMLTFGIVSVLSGIVDAKEAVKERRKIIPWVWRRKKLQGQFLIKQWDNDDFYIYESQFNLVQGWHWKKINYEYSLQGAEQTLRLTIDKRRINAGLPRIYNYEGRLI